MKKADLRVIRFNSDDVLATSCKHTLMAGMSTEYYNLGYSDSGFCGYYLDIDRNGECNVGDKGINIFNDNKLDKVYDENGTEITDYSLWELHDQSYHYSYNGALYTLQKHSDQ